MVGSKQSHDNIKEEVDLDVIINQISTDFLINTHLITLGFISLKAKADKLEMFKPLGDKTVYWRGNLLTDSLLL